MTQAYNLSQLANFVNSSGQLNAATGLYNSSSLGFASGTRMSFQQTSAPTGWTKDTTSTIDNSVLRLVTGTPSSGGSVAFSTWNSSGTTGAYTLTTTDIPSHSHGSSTGGNFWLSNTSQPSYNIANGNLNNANNGYMQYPSANTGNTGGGGSHSHSLSNNIKYYDFIIATKD